MKRPTIRLCLLLVSVLSLLSLNAQTIVNQDWLTSGGTPNGIYDFQASHVISPSNAVVLVGNTFHYGQAENFLISKYNADGGLIFKKEYDGSASSTDFATDVTTIGSDIYVTGVEGDTVSGVTYITTLKLDSVGNIIWTAKYQNAYKKYNLGFRIIPDPSNTALYVCGTSQTGPTDFALTLLKYKTAGGSPQWTATYDSVGLYDAGVDLKASTSSVFVYGISGLSSTSGDIITRVYNTSTGALQSQSRTNTSGAYITRPVAIAKDNAENIYLAGISNDAGKMDDIVIVKMDSLLNLKWRKYIDGGNSKNDGVSAIKIDSRNNIIMSGWAGNADGSKAIWTLKMRDSVIVWDKRRYCSVAGHDAQGFDLDLNPLNKVYVTGKTYNGSNFDQITLAYDSTGKPLWEKGYLNTNSSDDEGRNVKVDSGGNIYVYGRSNISGSYTYSTLKYREYPMTISYTLDGKGDPLCVKSRVLVRFDKSALDTTVLKDRNNRLFLPSIVLTSTAFSAIQARVPFDLGKSKLLCLTSLTPNDRYSTSRLGQQVPIPPMWATFALDYPTASKSEVEVAQILDSLFPTVIHAYPDYTLKPDQTSNDSLYSKQGNLHPIPGYDSANINLEPALDYAVGESFVKLAIIDDGLYYNHEDFGGSSTNTKMKGGADWTSNGQPWDYISAPNQGVTQHGTQVAGIAAALRNNVKGVAGIAGGNGTSGNPGASLYIFKIIPAGSDSVGLISHAYQAIVDNAVEGTDHSQGLFWGVHIMNNSWGVNWGGVYQDSVLGILEDAVHFANRNQVTFVASRGNDSTTDRNHYPAILWNTWVLSVGASGSDGWPANNFTTQCSSPFARGYNPAHGKGMDIIAPGGMCFVRSTLGGGSYTGFDGTSASAPHASGVAALLMNQLNQPTANFNNLAPEDVEGIEKTTAYYRGGGLVGSNPLWGAGRLDAGAALQYAWKPKYTLEHYCSSGADTLYRDPYTWNVIGHVKRPVQNRAGQWVNIGAYRIDMYDLQKTYTYIDSPTRHLKSIWAVHSLSDTYLPSSGDVQPIEAVSCCESGVGVGGGTANTYSGVIFHIRDSATGAHIAWLPYDTAYAKDSAKMCLTLIFDNTTITSLHDANMAKIGMDITLFPNPSHSGNTLVIDLAEPTSLVVDLYTISGQLVRSVWSGKADSGTHHIESNISDLPDGVYLYRVSTDNATTTKRFIKM